ncbi:MAG: hypothetical protein NC131_22110 [Roseburia sp.]|nr:hypothetical protein [Roseburia sp.]
MRGIGMISHFVSLCFLILFLWIGVTYVSLNIQYSGAKQFHGSVVQWLENSYFAPDVIEECRQKVEGNGYRLTIETYGRDVARDARVILDMDYTFPVIQVTKRYTIEGYAR